MASPRYAAGANERAVDLNGEDSLGVPKPTRSSISVLSSDFLPNQGQKPPPQRLNHTLKKDFIPNMAAQATALGKQWGVALDHMAPREVIGPDMHYIPHMADEAVAFARKWGLVAGGDTTTTSQLEGATEKANGDAHGPSVDRYTFKVSDAISADEQTAEQLKALYDEYLKKVKEEGAAATEGRPLFRVPPTRPKDDANGQESPAASTRTSYPKVSTTSSGAIQNPRGSARNQGRAVPLKKPNKRPNK